MAGTGNLSLQTHSFHCSRLFLVAPNIKMTWLYQATWISHRGLLQASILFWSSIIYSMIMTWWLLAADMLLCKELPLKSNRSTVHKMSASSYLLCDLPLTPGRGFRNRANAEVIQPWAGCEGSGSPLGSHASPSFCTYRYRYIHVEHIYVYIYVYLQHLFWDCSLLQSAVLCNALGSDSHWK